MDRIALIILVIPGIISVSLCQGDTTACIGTTSAHGTCQDIIQQDHGNSICDNTTKEGSTCTFSCEGGYYNAAGKSVTCHNGTWDGTCYNCLEVTCTDSSQKPSNSESNCMSASHIFGKTCDLKCNEGYHISGRGNATCKDSTPSDDTNQQGNWDYGNTQCTTVTCVEVSDPKFGIKTCTNVTNFGSTCTYLCDEGYYNKGGSNQTCEDPNPNDDTNINGVWTGTSYNCTVLQCPDLSNLNNGKMSCNDNYNYGSVCTYTCNEGYYNSGGESQECADSNMTDDSEDDGLWRGNNASCKAYMVLSSDNTNRTGIKYEYLVIEVKVTSYYPSVNISVNLVSTPNSESTKLNVPLQNISTVDNITTYGYNITNIKESDAGIYMINSTSTDDVFPNITQSININVTVEVPPENLTLTPSPPNFTYIINYTDNDTIICNGKGTPELTYTWKNSEGASIESTSDTTGIYSINETLHLEKSTYSNYGNYTCMASNIVGENNETRNNQESISIRIEGSPILQGNITTPPLQDNITLSCDISAYPKPNATWRRNQTIIGQNDQFAEENITEGNDDIYYTSTSEIILMSQLCMGEETITCTASNVYGNSTNENTYQLNTGLYGYHRESYYTFPLDELNKSDADAICEESNGHLVYIVNNETQNYLNSQVTSKTKGYYIGAVRNGTTWTWGEGGELVDTDFIDWNESESDGSCVVAFDNNTWKTVECDELHNYVCQLKASGIPTSLKIIPTTCDGTYINVTWIPDIRFDQTQHQITVTPMNGTMEAKCVLASKDERNHTFYGLQPNTNYMVQVSAGIDVCKAFFPTTQGYSVSGYDVPYEIDSANINKDIDVCAVQWIYPSERRWQIDKYQINYTATLYVDTGAEPEPTTVTYKENQSTTFEMKPNSKYLVTIAAISCAGTGKTVKANGSCITEVAAPSEIITSPALTDDGDRVSENTDTSTGIKVPIQAQNERNGPISCLFVVVTVDSSLEASQNRPTTNNNTPEYFLQIQNGNGDPGSQYFAYVTKETTVPYNLTLGVGDPKSNCTPTLSSTLRRKRASEDVPETITANNRQLNKGRFYRYYLYTTTPKGAAGDGFIVISTNVSITFITQNADTYGWVAAIVVPIVLIIIVGALFYYRRNYMKQEKDCDVGMREFPPIGNDDNIYENENFDVPRRLAPLPIVARELENVYTYKHADDNRLFRDEYKLVKENAKRWTESFEFAQNPELREKNRFTNVLPAKHARVILSDQVGEPHSDYINASYIDSNDRNKKFIAVQGPKPSTIDDMWRMVWEQGSKVIVMVTNVDENGKRKCEKYWPDESDTISYGHMSVTGLDVSNIGPIIRRRFQLSNKNNITKPRIITQYHFVAWPDHGVPQTTSGLFNLRRIMRTEFRDETTPTVVHCSAGVGRTGTFIAMDNLLDQLRQSQSVDIRSAVMAMRERRTEMVQTMDQYVLLHKMMLEAFLLKDTDMDISTTEEKLAKLRYNTDELQHEFYLASKIKPLDDDRDISRTPDHIDLNRDPDITPYDRNIVRMRIRPDEREPPYINASNINGYDPNDNFIVTQDPMTGGEELFWRMVLDHNVKCIVMIHPKNYAGEPCAKYFPGEISKHFGKISVTLKETFDENKVVERSIFVKEEVLNSTRSSDVQHFEFSGWPDGEAIKEDATAVMDLIVRVQRQKLKEEDKKAPIIVHSGDGSIHTGAFCGITNLLERLKTESRVDVVRTVKDLRDMRPGMVRDLYEYRFCYQAIKEYLSSFELYSNFR